MLSEAGLRVLRCGYYFSYILAPAAALRLLKAWAGRHRPAASMVSDVRDHQAPGPGDEPGVARAVGHGTAGYCAGPVCPSAYPSSALQKKNKGDS